MMCMLLFLGALKLGCRHSFKPTEGKGSLVGRLSFTINYFWASAKVILIS